MEQLNLFDFDFSQKKYVSGMLFEEKVNLEEIKRKLRERFTEKVLEKLVRSVFAKEFPRLPSEKEMFDWIEPLEDGRFVIARTKTLDLVTKKENELEWSYYIVDENFYTYNLKTKKLIKSFKLNVSQLYEVYFEELINIFGEELNHYFLKLFLKRKVFQPQISNSGNFVLSDYYTIFSLFLNIRAKESIENTFKYNSFFENKAKTITQTDYEKGLHFEKISDDTVAIYSVDEENLNLLHRFYWRNRRYLKTGRQLKGFLITSSWIKQFVLSDNFFSISDKISKSESSEIKKHSQGKTIEVPNDFFENTKFHYLNDYLCNLIGTGTTEFNHKNIKKLLVTLENDSFEKAKKMDFDILNKIFEDNSNISERTVYQNYFGHYFPKETKVNKKLGVSGKQLAILKKPEYSEFLLARGLKFVKGILETESDNFHSLISARSIDFVNLEEFELVLNFLNKIFVHKIRTYKRTRVRHSFLYDFTDSLKTLITIVGKNKVYEKMKETLEFDSEFPGLYEKNVSYKAFKEHARLLVDIARTHRSLKWENSYYGDAFDGRLSHLLKSVARFGNLEELENFHDSVVDLHNYSKLHRSKEQLKAEKLIPFKDNVIERMSKFVFEDDEFFITYPSTKSELTYEGLVNKNCVGSYYERVNNHGVNVLFFRKKAEPETPFYTLEVSRNILAQCYSVRNSIKLEENEKKFLNNWMKAKNITDHFNINRVVIK